MLHNCISMMFLHLLFNGLVVKPQLNFKGIRDDVDIIRTNIVERKASADVDLVVSLYETNVDMMKRSQDISQRRNEIARILAKERNPELAEEGKELKATQNRLEEERTQIELQLMSEGLKIPNMIHPESPRGGEPPRCIRTHGEVPVFEHTPKTHIDLGVSHNLIHFPQISGSSDRKSVV